jgi:drug/metabolite transporter (DMT)-like permease
MADRDLQPLTGVLLVVAGLFVLSCMDAGTKYLARTLAVPMMLGVRYIITSLLVAAVAAPRHGPALVRTRRTGLVIVRALCLVASSLLFASGIARIGMAEATSILFVGPVFVMLAGKALLQEEIGPLGWAAAALGLVGVLLIVRPGGGVDPLGAGLVAGAAVMASTYHIMSRALARTETTVAMLFIANLTGAIVFLPSLPWLWPAGGPSGLEMVLLLMSGILAGIGHFMVTAAHRHAPASLLAPATYSQLLWTALLGFIIFGSVPDGLAILGMLVIVVSGILTAIRSRRLQA